ncbi:type 3 dihydrofolate reductase [Longirhabdus pacifica]|uniref:type 3 dihydrofolate reductase n=1 Tax=Longirhabdus pacifica TaxID=2305227 RepID=UPI001008EC25|nr:type 3 dihydrofolate reductase [Longirhabdus pacifica]
MISLIFAMGENRVIGNNNQLPWHLPADLAFFKKTTMHHPIIMGRKTFESIGKALPGRLNIVVTRDKNYEAEHCTVVHSVDELVKKYGDTKEEVFVIGGAILYESFLPYANKMYITKIEHEFEGDAFFPKYDEKNWVEIEAHSGVVDEKNMYNYTFFKYERK